MTTPGLGSSDPVDRSLRDDDAVTEVPLSGEELRRKAAIGAVLISGRTLAVRLVGLGANVVLARLLTPADFGVIAFGLTLTTAGALLAEAGLGASLVRGQHDVRRSDLQALLAFQLLVGVALGMLASVIGLWSGHGGVIAVMVLSLPIAVFQAPGVILQERMLAYRTLATVEMIQHSSYYLWAMASVALGAGVWGLASAVVVRAAAGTLGMMVLTPEGRVRPRFNWAIVRRHIGFGAGFQGVGVVGMLREFGISAGTASIGGLSTLGLWSFSFGLLQAPFVVFEALYRISFPAMARLVAVGEDPGPMLQRALSVVGVSSGLLIAGLVGTAPALVPSVFGSRWEPAIDVLPWAAMGLVFSGPISVVSTGYLFARGRATRVLSAVAIAALTRVGVGLALLELLGLRGLGIGYLASSVAEAVVLAGGVKRLTHVRLARALLPSTFAAVVAAGAGWAVASSGETLLSTALSGATVLIVYVLFLALVDRSGMRLTWARLSGLLRSPA